MQPRVHVVHYLDWVVEVEADDSDGALEVLRRDDVLNELAALAVVNRPDVQLGQVVIRGDRRRCHLRVEQVLHVEERKVEGGEVAAHVANLHAFVARVHVLVVDLLDDAALARGEVPQQ